MSNGHDDDLQRIYDTWALVQERKKLPAIEREAWIGAARQLFAPNEREACCVCGRFKGISQAHHVVPLTLQYDRGFRYPDHEHVWLCPNHHAMVHLFIINDNRSISPDAFKARGRTTRRVLPDIDITELDKMMDLMRRACRSPK